METKKDKIFPRGIFFNRKHEKQPDFVKGSIVIKVSEFGEWLKQYTGQESIKLALLESRNTDQVTGKKKLYLELDTYVKDNEHKVNPPETPPSSLSPEEMALIKSHREGAEEQQNKAKAEYQGVEDQVEVQAEERYKNMGGDGSEMEF